LLNILPLACLNRFAACLLKPFYRLLAFIFCWLLAEIFLPPACFHFFAGCLLKSFCRLLAMSTFLSPFLSVQPKANCRYKNKANSSFVL
jgi:hypothetical protein